MRILPIIIIGFILAACGQDYMEIQGVKLGASIDRVKNLDRYEVNVYSDKIIYRNVRRSSDNNYIYTISAINGRVESISFYTKNDFEKTLSFLKKKYGEPDHSEEHHKEWDVFKVSDGDYLVVLLPRSSFILYVTCEFYKKYLAPSSGRHFMGY